MNKIKVVSAHSSYKCGNNRAETTHEEVSAISGDYGTITGLMSFCEKERYEAMREADHLCGFLDEAIAAGDGQWIVEYIRSQIRGAA
ncbi:hypothetical protein M2263_002350 [Providencia alcalifaciens]|nr:hypothetical protein [Providencia alcalifaciens]